MRHILPVRGCVRANNPTEGIAWRAPKRRSASARSDSIKGLAQSIAKPAYRRLLTAEPALRRAVPALIIAFLLTIASARSCRCWTIAASALAEADRKDIETVAEVLRAAARAAGAQGDRADAGGGVQTELDQALSTPRTTAGGRQILVEQPRRHRSSPPRQRRGLDRTALSDMLGDTAC